jgi:hypothetical protein
MHLILLWLAATTSAEPASYPTEMLVGVSEIVAETRSATPVLIRIPGMLADAFGGLDDSGCDIAIRATIRLTRSAIWVGMTVGDRREIGNLGDARDWPSLAVALREYRGSPAFEYRDDIELVADPEVTAEDIAHALHVAAGAGFDNVRYTLPGWESVRFFERESFDDRFLLRTIGIHSIAVAIVDSGIVVGSDDGALDFVPRRGARHDLAATRSLLGGAREAARQRGLTGGAIALKLSSGSWSNDLEELYSIATDVGYTLTRFRWIPAAYDLEQQARSRGLIPGGRGRR